MTPFGWPMWIVLVFLFAYGAVLGSFLNVCIYRLPQKDELWPSLVGLWSPPSYCPKCGRKIWRRDNIPILSWFLLRGRCRFCRRKISFRYPAIELFNALLFVLVYWLEVPGGFYAHMNQSCTYSLLGPTAVAGSWNFSPVAILNWRYAYHMVLFEALIVATFIDFDLRIIPDGVTVPGMLFGLLGGWILGSVWLVPVWFQSPELLESLRPLLPKWLQAFTYGPAVPVWIKHHPHWHGLAVSLAGLIVGGGLVWTVRLIGELVLKQEAMGFGDVTLMAMIGSFLGWQPTVIVFFLAPLCALLVVAVSLPFSRDREIPYGPYLSLAALVTVLSFKWLWPRVQNFFALGVLLFVAAALMLFMLFVSLEFIQLVKRLLGIPLYWEEEWWDEQEQQQQNEARSLEWLKQGSRHPATTPEGDWRRGSDWPGQQAADGSLFSNRWRQW